ncbi:flagellin lysine-N-methylase [Sulfidibacter corallicola]|uniref:Flagellin lysine-N-methylase n=1 Tax=Sulfidibacter corallicola TaxID=2818388 RepID=A0A8A4TMH7_SULCO|nr:flagellin lysine-N-methylase [Sulfidibacter corallicola]QTD51176.1 flagellin lysine-N-methylase [Sulfidibacter corallicola]
MSKSKPKPLTGLAYMNRFRCIGPDCEETCCYGWRINLPRAEYEDLTGIYGSQRDGFACFELNSLPEGVPERLANESFAFLKMKEDLFCPFLDKGLCVIHRDHGESHLPTVCATYPRRILELPREDVLTGSLSCPEMARVCLLDDDAMQPVILDRDQLPQKIEAATTEPEPTHYYARYYGAINAYIKWVLAQKELKVRDSAFLFLTLAVEIQPFFYRGVNENPASKLDEVLGRFADPHFIVERVKAFRGLPELQNDHVIELVLGAIVAGIKQRRSPIFAALAVRVLQGLPEVVAASGKGEISLELPVGDIRRRALDRGARLDAVFGPRLEAILRRFTVNFWVQNLFVDEPDLLFQVRKYLFYLGSIRFLLVNHPALLDSLSSTEAEATPVFEKAVVEVVQSFLRAYDHDGRILRGVLDGMQPLGLDRLETLRDLLLV